MLKAEVLYKAGVLARAESADSSECSNTLAVEPKIYFMPDTLPAEAVSRTEVSSGFEDLPNAEICRSEASVGSDASSAPKEAFTPESFPGPEEPTILEFSVPAVEDTNKHFLNKCVSHGGAEPLLDGEPFLQEGEPQLMPLELLPGLHDPFPEVEARLARPPCTVARAAVPSEDIPQVPVQVAAVREEFSGQSLAGVQRSLSSHRHLTSVAPALPPPSLGWLWLGGWLRGASVWGSGTEELCLTL